MAIITYPLNGIEYSAEDAETYLCTRESGVFSADDCFKASITGDREITLSPGLAWIRNADYTGKSVVSTAAVKIPIPVADGTLNRIDRIVLRFDKSANSSSIVLKQGTAASSPAAPAVERTELVYELGLYTINITASSVTVTSGDVKNTMPDETVCGIMRDGVTGIPTAQLQEQVDDLLDDLRETIAGIEDGSGFVFSLSGKSGHLTLEDVGAQPQTSVRDAMVKADASGKLVEAVEGTDYNRLQYTTLWSGFKTDTGTITLSDNMRNYGVVAVVTAANNITQQCISNLFFTTPSSVGLNSSNMRFICSNFGTGINGIFGPSGDYTKINIVQAGTSGYGICAVIGIK